MERKSVLISMFVVCLAFATTSDAQEFKQPEFNEVNPFAAPAGGNQALFLDDFGATENDEQPNVFLGIVTDVKRW